MVRRTKEEAAQTREAILDAAETLFYEKGVASTTLTQIAAEAGLTRGAIYWHFENKLRLFTAMQQRARLPQQEIFERGDAGELPTLCELYESTIAALEYLTTHERACKVLTILMFRCEYVGEMQDALVRHSDADAQMHRVITAIFEAASRRGDLQSECYPASAATAYVSAVGGIIAEWLKSDGAFDLVGVGSRMMWAIIAGYACRRIMIDEMASSRRPIRAAEAVSSASGSGSA